MTALADYFLTGNFSLARFSIEARARIRLGDPRLIVVRHMPRAPQHTPPPTETWWLCKYISDLDALCLGNPRLDHHVQVLSAADWAHPAPSPSVSLPWLSSYLTLGVKGWNNPLGHTK